MRSIVISRKTQHFLDKLLNTQGLQDFSLVVSTNANNGHYVARLVEQAALKSLNIQMLGTIMKTLSVYAFGVENIPANTVLHLDFQPVRFEGPIAQEINLSFFMDARFEPPLEATA